MQQEEDDVQVLDCGDEALFFYPERGVRIVPIHSLTFFVDLPICPSGQTFSNWDIREKIKSFAHPHELKNFKVVESSDRHIKFTAHVSNSSILDEVIKTLNNITFRAPGFESPLRVKAKIGGCQFPKPEDWSSCFKLSNFNQTEPGLRPDTIHVIGLPYEWFAPNVKDDVSSIMIKVMSQYGKVRQIDIPQEDPYRCEMEKSISGTKLNWFHGSYSPFFEMYVQYEEYKGFYNAMTKMSGHQLARKTANGIWNEYQYTIEFDKHGHLSNKMVIQRELTRRMIIQKKKQEERKIKDLEIISQKSTVEAERNALESKVKAEIERSEKQRILDEQYLRKKLKNKKRQQTVQRIRESENLLKFLLVDEVIRIEWEKEQKKNPTDKIREYLKSRKLPEENSLRRRLMQKREIELRSGMAKKRFDPSTDSRPGMSKPVSLNHCSAEAIKEELMQFELTPHQQRQQMYRGMKTRREMLLKQVGNRLKKYRTKFKEDPVFDRERLPAPEAKQPISINIKTKSLNELHEKVVDLN